ncbi:hypothetical protein HOB10_00100 [Candidatus Parcubacteria bacterium]|jgi:hypothetical protein|nr:hypothetical protein [Candidatus Parcubacteria bacterium]
MIKYGEMSPAETQPNLMRQLAYLDEYAKDFEEKRQAILDQAKLLHNAGEGTPMSQEDMAAHLNKLADKKLPPSDTEKTEADQSSLRDLIAATESSNLSDEAKEKLIADLTKLSDIEKE